MRLNLYSVGMLAYGVTAINLTAHIDNELAEPEANYLQQTYDDAFTHDLSQTYAGLTHVNKLREKHLGKDRGSSSDSYSSSSSDSGKSGRSGRSGRSRRSKRSARSCSSASGCSGGTSCSGCSSNGCTDSGCDGNDSDLKEGIKAKVQASLWAKKAAEKLKNVDQCKVMKN